MEQRVYRGNVSPDGLADHLVNTFNQGYDDTVAQKAGQGNQCLVQIGHGRHQGRYGIRNAIGVSIVHTDDGISVGMGQSNWLNLGDPALAGTLFASIWFPPLLIFPLLRGIRNYAIYGRIWDAVDAYCMQAGAAQSSATTAHGVACPRCGVLNHEEARYCTTCGADLAAAPSPAAGQQVVCGECHQTVPAGRFCNNCGTALAEAPR